MMWTSISGRSDNGSQTAVRNLPSKGQLSARFDKPAKSATDDTYAPLAAEAISGFLGSRPDLRQHAAQP